MRKRIGAAPVRESTVRERRSTISTGRTRSAGRAEFVIAATAELHGLTLLHRDRDFGVIARVMGQPVWWYGPGP